MPAARARIPYARTFIGGELAQLARGLEPQAMEDKWLVYLAGDELYLHRSWTGICIYVVKLDANVVEAAWANRDPSEYTCTDDAHDARMLEFLVDRLLLGKDVAFPITDASSLLVHHLIGHGRTAGG